MKWGSSMICSQKSAPTRIFDPNLHSRAWTNTQQSCTRVGMYWNHIVDLQSLLQTQWDRKSGKGVMLIEMPYFRVQGYSETSYLYDTDQ